MTISRGRGGQNIIFGGAGGWERVKIGGRRGAGIFGGGGENGAPGEGRCVSSGGD